MSVVNGAPDPFFTGLHKCRYHFTEEQRRDFCDKVLAIGNAIVDIHISVFAHLDLPIFAKSSNIRFYSSSLAPTFTITAFSTYYYYQQIGFYKNVRACIYHRSRNFGPFFLNQKSKSFINFISVAVVAQRMAFGTSINHAFAPTGGVTSTLQSEKIFFGELFSTALPWKSSYIRSPTELLSDPTNLGAAVGASDPITAPFLQ